MKKNYILAAFQETLTQRFPAQAERLQAQTERRMQELWAAYAGASPELHRHLESQIIPGIAVYETLQTVMPRKEAYQTVHGYVEQRAWKIRRAILKLMHVPGLWQRVPGIATKGTRKMFGTAAGFQAVEKETDSNVWRIDMVKCPYHDACVTQGCPELCPCFCDSDDITYDGIHPRLVWHRTKTLGRGDDCCDFCLRAEKGPERKAVQ